MDLEKCRVFTTTWYPRAGAEGTVDRVRAERCLALLKNADSLGLSVVMVDGGSDAWFLDQAQGFLRLTILPEPKGTMGSGRRFAWQQASELAQRQGVANPLFLWVEPEKADLLTEENLTVMMIPLIEGQADIIRPERQPDCIATMPDFQARVEGICNKFASQQLPRVYDHWFGPAMFNPLAAQWFAKYNSDGKAPDKWDSIIVPFIEAVVHGSLRIMSVPVAFAYDLSEKLVEDGNPQMEFRRMLQAEAIYRALLASKVI